MNLQIQSAMQTSSDEPLRQTIEPLRLAILEDNGADRDAWQQLLSLGGDIEVVVSTASATEFIDMVDLHRPHVAWIDLMIGDDPFAGIEVINQVRQIAPETHCMVYTQFSDSLEHFVKAVRAGASAFLPKSRMHDFRQLRDCIMRVALGEQMLDPILLRRMAQIVDESRLRRMTDEGLEMEEYEPTQGELRVLEALARDKSNPEIAQELVISINTVKTHLRNLYGKTGAHNRTELLLISRSRNWLQKPDDQSG